MLDADVLLRLRPARHHRRRLAELSAPEGAAQEEPGGEAVAGHVILEVDDVAGLLAAEDRAFAL